MQTTAKYALRRALAGAWLDVDQEEIGLDPDADIWLDVNEFRRLLAGCEAHGHPVWIWNGPQTRRREGSRVERGTL